MQWQATKVSLSPQRTGNSLRAFRRAHLRLGQRLAQKV